MKTLFPLSCALLLLTSCSESPTGPAAKKEPEKPPEAIAGQSALYKMYQVARNWAGDAQVLKMNTIALSEVPDVPRGKAAAWQATFTSASRNQARSYTYSIVESQGNLHKGVFAGLEEGWSGPHGVTAPFPIMAVKIETDTAFQTALKQGEDYDKKNPGKPISFLLEKENKFPDPVWRVIWGESVGTSNFSVIIDASTGDYKEKLH
ncbi:MAG TPA: hypothetical protein VGH38_37455 [Bryobacteraceae bacterium]